MKRFFGLLDNYEGGRKSAVRVLGLVLLLQLLDYATTKAISTISGGSAAEFNPFARGIIESSRWGIEYLLVLKFVFVLALSIYCLSLKKSRFLVFDFLVTGVLVFGFLFIVLGNIVHLLGLGFFALTASWLPEMPPTGVVNSLDIIILYLTFALSFSSIGIYIWLKYKRLFCFGPVIICLWMISFAVMNLI